MILNKLKLIFITLLTSLILTGFNSHILAQDKKFNELKTFHDFVVKTIDGENYPLSQLKGKKVIVVNTASKCGLTPQYEILQKIYKTLDTSKFQIIAFPANNFLEQDPGTNSEIKEFCQKNYGVSFPIMAKVSVCDYIFTTYPVDTAKAKKTSTDELYKWLTQKSENGVMDTRIRWNFQKFLIDEHGKLIGTLPPNVCEEILTINEWLTN